jgi:hypothetical protein
MPIVSPADATLAGIFGGSGSHVIQIIVLIVVAAVLIGYFGLRLARGSGGVHAGPAFDSEHEHDIHRANEGATSDGTVRLVRLWTGIIGARNEQWNIAIDGTVVGSVANNETVDVAVAPGHHALRLGSGRHRSPERSFDVARDQVVGFNCHGPRIWPMLVAALINPSRWITLTRT